MAMGVRTAMLLALVFTGIVALYLETRDRWNWAKLSRRLILGLMLLVGVVGGWIYWSSLPPTSPASELWGISLGASKSDVLFLKGEPSVIVEPDTWIYALSRNRTYRVAFGDADEVVRIVVVSGPGFGSGAPFFGIRTGFGGQRLVDRLGEPTRVLRSPDDLRRAYLYDHLNAVFILEQSVVVSYGIYDIEAGRPYSEGGAEAG
jgi:hypothetical protein